MITYLDSVLYIYPNIQRVVYWRTQIDGTPWNDPYDGLLWDNPDIEKPSKEVLDALDATTVSAELARRAEVNRKIERDARARKDLALMSNYHSWKQAHPLLTLHDYLDFLETLSDDGQ